MWNYLLSHWNGVVFLFITSTVILLAFQSAAKHVCWRVSLVRIILVALLIWFFYGTGMELIPPEIPVLEVNGIALIMPLFVKVCELVIGFVLTLIVWYLIAWCLCTKIEKLIKAVLG